MLLWKALSVIWIWSELTTTSWLDTRVLEKEIGFNVNEALIFRPYTCPRSDDRKQCLCNRIVVESLIIRVKISKMCSPGQRYNNVMDRELQQCILSASSENADKFYWEFCSSKNQVFLVQSVCASTPEWSPRSSNKRCSSNSSTRSESWQACVFQRYCFQPIVGIVPKDFE